MSPLVCASLTCLDLRHSESQKTKRIPLVRKERKRRAISTLFPLNLLVFRVFSSVVKVKSC